MKLKLMAGLLAVTCLCLSVKKIYVKPDNEYRQMADSIFDANKSNADFKFQRYFITQEGEYPRVAVMIGHLFNEKNHALLLHSVNDSVYGIRLLEKKQSGWKTILEKPIPHGYLGMVDDFVSFYDINADGQKELLLLNDYRDFHTADFLRAFSLIGNHLTEIKDLEQYPNPEFDGKGHLTSYTSAGCADMYMYFEEARIEKDTIRRLKTVFCDCCTDSIRGDSCEIRIDNQEPFRVKSSKAPDFVPESYREAVKQKLEMGSEN